MPYPVLAEALLRPVTREFLRRPRRDSRELPAPRIGSVYVFRADGVLHDYGRRAVDYADPIVVEATEVYQVQVRPQQVVAELGLGTVDRDVLVRAVFRCVVLNAATVVDAGLSNLGELLTTYFAGDTTLSALAQEAGRASRAGTLEELRAQIEGRVWAYCAVAPPEIDGMRITLAGSSVIAEGDLAPSTAPTGGRP